MSDHQVIYAVSYARVSTDDHDQKPESQHVAIRAYAKTKGYTIVREFSDEITGTTDERSALQSLYGFKLDHPEITKVIVLCQDRLSRDMDGQRRIREKLNSLGLEIIYVDDENLDTTKKEGKVMETLKAYAAQSYVDDLKIKIRAGQERARQEGKVIGRPLKRADDIEPRTLLQFIAMGKSLRDLEKIYNCSRETLKRRIDKAGLSDEYNRIMEERKNKKNAVE